MKLKRKIALVLSAVMLCSSVSIPASAKEVSTIIENEVAPAYVNARKVENTLTISSATASCVSKCTGFSDIVQISVEQTLQKFWGLWIWNDVDGASWSSTENGNVITLVKSKSGLSSGTYRLKSVFTLTSSSGKTETITIYSGEKTVG